MHSCSCVKKKEKTLSFLSVCTADVYICMLTHTYVYIYLQTSVKCWYVYIYIYIYIYTYMYAKINITFMAICQARTSWMCVRARASRQSEIKTCDELLSRAVRTFCLSQTMSVCLWWLSVILCESNDVCLSVMTVSHSVWVKRCLSVCDDCKSFCLSQTMSVCLWWL